MVNDITTLNGSLMELGETLASNITAKGVSASASDGLTTLANKVLQITGGGGSTTLFEDACSSASGLSNYGNSISIWKTNTATANISYDSTENAYLLKGSGNYNAIIPITAVSNLDNYVMTFKAKHKVNSAYSQPSYFNYDTNTPTQPTSYGVRYLGDGRIMCDTFTSTNDTSSNTVTGKTSGIASEYFTYKITKQGVDLHFEIENSSGTNIYDKTMTVENNYKGISFGVATENGESNSSYYVKDIKIESLDTPTTTVLFYDDCSTDRSSEYTKVDNNCTFTYDSNGYYVLTKTSSSGNSGVKINSTQFPKNVKITVDVQMKTTGNTQPKIVFMDTTQTYGYVTRLTYINGKGAIINGSFTSEGTDITGDVTVSQSLNKWYTLEFVKNNNDLTYKIYDKDTGTLVETLTGTGSLTFSENANTIGMAVAYDSSKYYWFKNLKVESLDTPYSPCSEYQTQIENAITYINGSGN